MFDCLINDDGIRSGYKRITLRAGGRRSLAKTTWPRRATAFYRTKESIKKPGKNTEKSTETQLIGVDGTSRLAQHSLKTMKNFIVASVRGYKVNDAKQHPPWRPPPPPPPPVLDCGLFLNDLARRNRFQTLRERRGRSCERSVDDEDGGFSQWNSKSAVIQPVRKSVAPEYADYSATKGSSYAAVDKWTMMTMQETCTLSRKLSTYGTLPRRHRFHRRSDLHHQRESFLVILSEQFQSSFRAVSEQFQFER